MATYTSTSGSYTTTLTVNQTSQSIENNTSTLTYSLTLTKNAGYGLYNGNSCPWSITINGTTVSGTFTYDFQNYSSLTLKGSTTMTVTHNNDGTKSVSCSASVNMDNEPYVYTMTPSGTLTLTTIPRASDVAVNAHTISSTSGSLSFTITSKANFYHKWRYKLNAVTGSWSSALHINTTTNSPTISNTNLLNAMPTQQVSAITIEVQTYSDSGCTNLVGTKSASANITVTLKPSAPTLTTLGFRSRSSGVDSSISTPTAGYTTVALTAWTSGTSQGASSYTTYFSVNQKATLKTASATANNTVIETNTLPASSKQYTLTYTAYTVDSRGLQSTNATKTVTVYGYQPPVASLKAFRTTNDTTTAEDGAGIYARVEFSPRLRGLTNTSGTLISSNPNSVLSATCTRSGYSSGSCTTGTNYSLPDNSTMTFTYTVTDKFTTSTAKVTVPVAVYVLDLYDDGNGTVGVGLGTLAHAGQLISELPVTIHGQAGNTPLKVRGIQGASATGEDGDLYINIKGGGVTYFGTNGGGNISADGTQYSGRANNATYVDWTETDTDTNTLYYLPFGAGYSDNTTNRGLLSNADLKVQLRNGTSSAYGYSGLILGNGTDQGTAGNKWGFVNMYPLTGNYYGRIRSAETLTGNRTVYIPDNSGTLLTDTRTSYSGANVLSRSSGLTISSRQAVLIANGEIVVVYLALTGNMTLAVGDNAFLGTLNTTNIPLPKYSAHDMTYYGSTVFGGYIDTSGNITVRVMAAGTNISTDTIALTFMYLKA